MIFTAIGTSYPSGSGLQSPPVAPGAYPAAINGPSAAGYVGNPATVAPSSGWSVSAGVNNWGNQSVAGTAPPTTGMTLTGEKNL